MINNLRDNIKPLVIMLVEDNTDHTELVKNSLKDHKVLFDHLNIWAFIG